MISACSQISTGVVRNEGLLYNLRMVSRLVCVSDLHSNYQLSGAIIRFYINELSDNILYCWKAHYCIIIAGLYQEIFS